MLVLKLAALVFVVFAAAVLVWFLGAEVEGGIWRALIAAAMGTAIAVFGIGFFRQMGDSTPDPEPESVPSDFRLVYVCEMCGMELSVIKVAKEKAPKHCGEEMVLVSRQI